MLEIGEILQISLAALAISAAFIDKTNAQLKLIISIFMVLLILITINYNSIADFFREQSIFYRFFLLTTLLIPATLSTLWILSRNLLLPRVFPLSFMPISFISLILSIFISLSMISLVDSKESLYSARVFGSSINNEGNFLPFLTQQFYDSISSRNSKHQFKIDDLSHFPEIHSWGFWFEFKGLDFNKKRLSFDIYIEKPSGDLLLMRNIYDEIVENFQIVILDKNYKPTESFNLMRFCDSKENGITCTLSSIELEDNPNINPNTMSSFAIYLDGLEQLGTNLEPGSAITISNLRIEPVR